MLSVMTSNNHRILSLKLLLISSAVVSTAAMLKFSVPVVAEILVSDVPAIWSSIVFWLRPPYLYLLLNFIIISILASSMLHHDDLIDPPKLSADSQVDYTVHRAVGAVLVDSCDRNANEDLAADVSENDAKSMASERENDESGEADRIGLQKDDSVEILLQKHDKKPPISSKVSNRKVTKAATPTRAAGTKSRWSNTNGDDTLDDAWKTITEGRSAPFSRPLDKSDTFESQTAIVVGRNSSDPLKVKKSETTGNGVREAAPARVRKKASLTEEELNRQVEAFIEKFKEEMRLQREESLKKFQKMRNYY